MTAIPLSNILANLPSLSQRRKELVVRMRRFLILALMFSGLFSFLGFALLMAVAELDLRTLHLFWWPATAATLAVGRFLFDLARKRSLVMSTLSSGLGVILTGFFTTLAAATLRLDDALTLSLFPLFLIVMFVLSLIVIAQTLLTLTGGSLLHLTRHPVATPLAKQTWEQDAKPTQKRAFTLFSLWAIPLSLEETDIVLEHLAQTDFGGKRSRQHNRKVKLLFDRHFGRVEIEHRPAQDNDAKSHNEPSVDPHLFQDVNLFTPIQRLLDTKSTRLENLTETGNTSTLVLSFPSNVNMKSTQILHRRKVAEHILS